MDQARGEIAHAIHVVEPGDEVPAGHFIPMRKMLCHPLGRTPRQLTVSGRVQVGPIGQGRELRPYLIPVDTHEAGFSLSQR